MGILYGGWQCLLVSKLVNYKEFSVDNSFDDLPTLQGWSNYKLGIFGVIGHHFKPYTNMHWIIICLFILYYEFLLLANYIY